VPKHRRRKAVPDAINYTDAAAEADHRQQQQELLSISPAQMTLHSHPLPAGAHEMLEDGVACLVPMRIVDGLEVIDVDHGNA
jgi:hypothetical protein